MIPPRLLQEIKKIYIAKSVKCGFSPEYTKITFTMFHQLLVFTFGC